MADNFGDVMPQAVAAGPRKTLRLGSIIDPYFYVEQMTLPKFYAQTTNDFAISLAMIKDVKRWWPSLPEPKSLYMATAEHDNALTFHGALEPITAFMRMQILGQPMPKITYSAMENDLWGKGKSITVTQASNDLPIAVNLISATTDCSTEPEGDILRSTFYKSDDLVAKQKEVGLAGALSRLTESLPRRSWTAQVVEPGAQLRSDERACPKVAFMTAEYAGPPGSDNIRLSSPLYVM